MQVCLQKVPGTTIIDTDRPGLWTIGKLRMVDVIHTSNFEMLPGSLLADLGARGTWQQSSPVFPAVYPGDRITLHSP